ncbi:protoporphyrinogen oxidase HemJ [Leptonema illini]|jgi:putative membrane protein|uniref:Protoporphyrinogen IX oxidase n=1 Tax=Leptonema illini DSM 21528 TaxID=929563 RepID=H2CI20_9LEPT|nr:protoporphyrinogen oxidase HemJ [Leptonema illini]EHQ08043.1 Conserved hypothetical protein CHP00701 [Leptonema illini DSM 21528]PKL35015.1 MAG: protoporphyrinogen oxidase HemJ [Spirochaetae bacterium HGW-Spirochaetae-10]
MTYYLWIKAFHIIALVAWFAGLFYIWRLFVYHAMNDSPAVKEQLGVMESKLIRIIMNPAMIVTTVLGLVMLFINLDYFMAVGWIWTKLMIVLVLFANHFLAVRYHKRLMAGEAFDHKRFRFLNELPTLVLIAVVILAVVKPF